MPVNDFLKLNSCTFPNDILTKKATNAMFNTKINRKNDHEIDTKNSGMTMETNDVATIHEKMIFFRFCGLTA